MQEARMVGCLASPILVLIALGSCDLTWSQGSTQSLAAASRLDAEYRHDSWRREDGLPEDRVTALMQAREGYLWVGTRFGLVRFDGLNFVVFNHLTIPAMVSDECTDLAEDRDGSLWIATAAGLVHWDRVGGSTRYTTLDGLCDDRVTRLCPSQAGGIWVGTSRGLNRIQAGKVRRFTTADGLHYDYVTGLAEETDGALLVGNAGPGATLQRCSSRGGAVQFTDVPGSPIGDTVDDIRSTAEGNPVIYAGQVLLRLDSGRCARIAERTFPTAGGVGIMLTDHQGDIWLSAGKLGVDRYRDGQFTRFELWPGQSNDGVLCLAEDREGNVWAGTESSGLHRLTPRRIHTHTVRDGLAHDNAWAICQTRDGSLWVGTDGGLSQLDCAGNRTVTVTNYTEAQGLAKNTIRALAEDASGTLWIGTGAGLDERRGGRFIHHRFPGNPATDPQELARNKVRVICPTRDGAVWIGVPEGLWRLLGEQCTFYDASNGLPGGDVRALLQARDGALWIGTAGGGLARVGLAPTSPLASPGAFPPLKAGERLQTLAVFSATNGLASNYAWALHEDRDGVIWVGTDRGLHRIRRSERNTGFAVTVFTTHDGLLDNAVNGVLEDDLGNLWLSGERGLCRVRKEELDGLDEAGAARAHCVHYDSADGMLTAETNGQKSQPPGWKTGDGRLWFPTPRGVVMVDPRAAVAQEPAPPVVLERFLANNQTVLANGPDPTFSFVPRSIPRATPAPVITLGSGRARPDPETAASTAALRIPPGGARSLEFRYTATCFTAPKQVRFKYRLEGLETEWTEAGTRRVAYYTDLRPGSYVFQVRAASRENLWSETAATVAFVIAPHFYQTGWFGGLCLSSLAGVVYGAHRHRVGVVRRRQHLEHQRALAQQRTLVARDLHDDLGARLHEIALLSDLARLEADRGIPAKAGAVHLERVATASRELQASLDETVWVLDPGNDTLSSLLAHLRAYAAEYLRLGGLRVHFDWPNHVPDVEFPARARYHLVSIVKEALHNLVQHAGATEARLGVSLGDGVLTVMVGDNGRGFDAVTARAAGNGLTNMNARIAELGGTCQISSAPNAGATLRFTMPLPGALNPNG